MENRDNNQIKKSSSIKSEDIKDLKEILEIEKLSRLLERFYSATGLANFIVDLKGTYCMEWVGKIFARSFIENTKHLQSDVKEATQFLQID